MYAPMTSDQTEALTAFVARLRTARIERKLTLRQVADLLGTANKTVVGNWEMGERWPVDPLLRSWAAVLDVEVPDGVQGRMMSSPTCGTVAAMQAHRRRGETPCTPCREASNAYQRAWKSRRRRS